MKKFADKFNENISLIKTALGDVCSVTHVKAVFKDWVSPEDHQAEVDKRKQQYEDHQEIYSKTAKKLNEAELELSKLKSQLEKQQPEIPEFMANYIEAAKEDFWTLLSAMDDSNLSSRVGDWLKGGNFRNQEIFAQAWTNGYTVAKEKRFYLNNKLTGLNLVEEKTFSLTGKHVGERFREFEMQYIPTDEQEARLYKNTFTQQEINSMETGSYEQIEVEE